MNSKRKKAGRPPKPLGEKQGSRITVNMTRAERAELGRDAAKAGGSLAGRLLQCWREREARHGRDS